MIFRNVSAFQFEMLKAVYSNWGQDGVMYPYEPVNDIPDVVVHTLDFECETQPADRYTGWWYLYLILYSYH